MRTPTAAVTVLLPALMVSLLAPGVVARAPTPSNNQSCESSVAHCANYLNGTSSPSDDCCETLRTSLMNEPRCLCDLFASPEIFAAFNISMSEVYSLADRCFLKDFRTICPGNVTVPPALPPRAAPPAMPPRAVLKLVSNRGEFIFLK
uniref:Bifunctional inhibitor/plant lipid transfer protein/seed storage helical domain-containing protein n=1 Tax=Leersia perrieri TaxID=77586 RepID=A0A0D9XSY7_9ORYZ